MAQKKKKKEIMISYTAYKNILNLVQEVQEYSTVFSFTSCSIKISRSLWAQRLRLIVSETQSRSL